MMATEVKHQPLILSSRTMAHHATNIDHQLSPKLMMVNADMAKDLRHLDRYMTPKGTSSSWLSAWDKSATSDKMLQKKLEGSVAPPLKEFAQLDSPKSISASGDCAMCPTNVNSRCSSTSSNLTNLARPIRRRCQSTPVSGTSQRRTIFASFWKKDGEASSMSGDTDSDTMSAASARSRNSNRNGRGRAHSISTVPNSPNPASPSRESNDSSDPGSSARDGINIMMFTPPLRHKSVIMSHFNGLQDLPEEMHMTLPALPAPLSRTYRSDGTHYNSGMYPLVAAKSILQRASYGHDPAEEQLEDSITPSAKLIPPLGKSRKSAKGNMVMPLPLPLPLALTDSIHLNSMSLGGKQRRIGSISNDLQSDESSSTQSASRHRVSFDPRITISELYDEMPRKWYSDGELDKFKMDTILIAQRYLRLHPELVPDYCSGVVDPVTGVAKRKALYSLPVLNNVALVDGEDSDDSMAASPTQLSSSRSTLLYDYAKMARIHVRKILIIDPNKLVLDLFCRSLQQIFPDAKLTAVQSGGEALYHIEQLYKTGLSQGRAFDLVIVEERLHALPLRSPCMTTNPTKDRSSKQLARAKHNSMTQLTDYNKATTASTSMNTCHRKLISGSEVMRRIKQLEFTYCPPDCPRGAGEYDSSGEEPSQCKEQFCWRSLLVGVCVDQKHDALKLWQSGADLVWGKPPPPMGENLRNTLVSMLVRRRSRASGK